MFLRKLSVLQFKNVSSAEFSFSSRVNCLVGGNGAGKTNLLDAIHYLSCGRSAFPVTDGQSVRHGDEFFVVEGDYGEGERVVCSFKKGEGKTLKRNGKIYDRLSDHVGVAPVVMISPMDTMLIMDAAQERRRWIDGFISQLDKGYLAALMRYNSVLRNRLLKMGGGGEVLDIFDMQLTDAGQTLWHRRKEVVEGLAPRVERYYRVLSGDTEGVELEYRSQGMEGLRDARDKDRMAGFTTSGIHRDDVVMTIGGHALRKYGSQGQQKSFLIALKLAQFVVAAETLGRKPILLLDDLFDRLDASRVGRLIALVAGDDFGQIFITDCNKTRLEDVLGGVECDIFEVASL